MLETILKINPQPVCVGTGLVTLDIIINGDTAISPRVWVGGSCGNVLTILSYLGWKTIPIIRLGKDEAAKRILEDWEHHDVDFTHIEQDANVLTPIIVEKIHLNKNGSPKHCFIWTCPNCGSWFPKYRPIKLTGAKQAFSKIDVVNCFYFDRVSPASLELATKAKEAGALIVFEPPSIKDNDSFRKAIKICHVLKYANNRIFDEIDFVFSNGPILIIETLGKAGIRFTLKNEAGFGQWICLPSFSVKEFRDACGAGDWCTAGLIYNLGVDGYIGLENASENKIIEALELGQAMAAFNCQFEGARGGMYALEKNEFWNAIERIMNNRIVDDTFANMVSENISELISCICSGCTNKK